MTARRIELPGSQGPANDGERRVVEALVEKLPDDYVVYPGFQVTHRNNVDDIDVFVVAPDCLCVVEVKDLAGEAVVTEQDFRVDGESRSHPFLATEMKAKRLKSRLMDADRELRNVWVAALVVLARPPRSLDRAPSLTDKVVGLDHAIDVLRDTSRLGSRGQALGGLLTRVEGQLQLQAKVRRKREAIGGYRITEVLRDDADELVAKAESELTGREVRLRVIHLSAWSDAAENQLRRTRAIQEAEIVQRLGDHPSIAGPREIFRTDAGDIVLVADPQSGPSLAEAVDAGALDDQTKRRVLRSLVSAVVYAHNNGIVHRRISPSLIELPSSGTMPKLSGFGFAKVTLRAPGASPTVGPDDWSGVIDDGFVPPELTSEGRDAVGDATDYWSIGRVAEFMWPGGVPAELAGVVEKLQAIDPATRADAFDELRSVVFERPAEPPPVAPVAPVAPTFVPQPGAHLGEYVLDEPLGDGSSSSVWKAYEPLAGEPCAIKILTLDEPTDALRREYQTLRAIHHPHVVEWQHASTADGATFLSTTFDRSDGRSPTSCSS